MPAWFIRLLVPVVLTGLGCGSESANPTGIWEFVVVPELSEPVSNNAVAAVVTSSGECYLFSALGIGSSLQPDAIRRSVFTWDGLASSWAPASPLPRADARVAASAIGVDERFVLLGGYSVAPDLSELSSENVDILDPVDGSWSVAAPLPIPIDDAVALPWGKDHVVVVSGWSDTRSVSDVQIYDLIGDVWMSATPFPGEPVFGHSGAIVGNEILIIDGVASRGFRFEIVNQAWRGTLDPGNPGTIMWEDLGAHPGPARYRAAGGSTADGAMWFHGGTEMPYNFDGLTYANSTPAVPLASTLTYSSAGGFAELMLPKPSATMDHRALPRCGSDMFVIGGLDAGLQARGEVWRITPPIAVEEEGGG